MYVGFWYDGNICLCVGHMLRKGHIFGYELVIYVTCWCLAVCFVVTF